MSSTAVGLERKSRIVGYKITKGNFAESSPNLPMRIAILAEANAANQTELNTDGVAVLSAQKAGELYGYGSPIYHIMRILRPVTGSGIVGGIPTIVYAQEEAGSATARVQTITVTGTATANATHSIAIAGRGAIDGTSYDINVNTDDTPTQIAVKIKNAINNVLGSPVTAANTAGVVTVTTKWKGLTAQDVGIRVSVNNAAAGVTYAVAEVTAATGTPSVTDALAKFGNEWNTIVINGYGFVQQTCSDLEAFNGIPDDDNPTGRYNGIVMKPFIALTGTTLDDPTSLTDARKNNVTIASCPAPLSDGLPFEAAANYAALFARCVQDTPHLDISGKYLPDMPIRDTAIAMADYDTRDAYVKLGCSTVDIVAGLYQVQDFVTTYHPVGETPAQFAYCRNIMLDLNIRYTYYLLEQTHVVDHAIAADGDVVTAAKVIKPKQWKGIINKMAEDLGKRALVADVPFFQKSIVVNLSTSNPDRLETFFRYKRTGYLRIASTTAEAGFNFGVAA